MGKLEFHRQNMKECFLRDKVEYPITHINTTDCQAHSITQRPTISFFFLPFYTCMVWYMCVHVFMGLLMRMWIYRPEADIGCVSQSFYTSFFEMVSH